MNEEFTLVRRTASEKKAYIEGYREGAMVFSRQVEHLLNPHDFIAAVMDFVSRMSLHEESKSDGA